MEKQTVDFTLSPKNLINIPFNKYQQDFTLIVNGEKYKTTRIVADLLSPLIREIHLVDSTIDEFSINVRNNNNTDYLTEFLNLVCFTPKLLDSDRINQFSDYFYELGNISEYIRLQVLTLKQITTENVLDQFSKIIKISEENGQRSKTIENFMKEESIEKIISFISSHFYDLDEKKIQLLPVSIISEILDREDLRIESEDSLLNLIIEKYRKTKYSELFEKIYFNNVSEKAIEKFIEAFHIDDLNQNIWKSICVRLLPSRNPPTPNISRYKLKYKKFKIEKGHEFEGIMRYLSKKTNGNIHDNGTIEITSNSLFNNNYQPRNVVDYENDNYYCSKNEENVFVLFDFKDKLIQLTNYSIRTHSDGKNHGNLKNWIIEASKDGEKWEEIDRRSNDSSLNEPNSTSTFNVKKGNNKFYRFIRLRQTGYSWDGYPSYNRYYQGFRFIEFFGKLQETQPKKKIYD